MTEKTYLLTIPGSPKSVNAGGGGSRSHHFVAHKEKKMWEGCFMMELMAARVLKQMQFVTVNVCIVFKNRNRHEKENYRHPVAKPLLDALKSGGYIADDTEEYVEIGEFKLHYPEDWSQSTPFKDPRLKSYMDIRLEASYL